LLLQYGQNFRSAACNETVRHSASCRKKFSHLVKFQLCSSWLSLLSKRMYLIMIKSIRVCACCTMQSIENEYHFTLICPAYWQLRLKYLPIYYWSWPNMFKFLSLMKNNRKSVIYKLVCFLRDSWNLRNLILKDK
jgi:hypothetical protein